MDDLSDRLVCKISPFPTARIKLTQNDSRSILYANSAATISFYLIRVISDLANRC